MLGLDVWIILAIILANLYHQMNHSDGGGGKSAY